ncbi:MAG: DNA polymerase III subunit gamma/tau, partial [bacterium]|nr:DNA polymerase III subunit gamma/tau [bacterium]
MFIGSARKWRPQKFEELIGQDHIRRTLSNALSEGRVASAYLFSGTRGVGKTTTARVLAKALNCESADGPVAEPCNQCASCAEISQGNHPDILEIDGATYTGVDHVRDLREGLRYRPARGRVKVIIIDEVHMLSKGAFNALLKTLEEPPPHVVFIFATTEIQRVPETILSRCQVFEFRRIPARIIEEQLARIVQDQGGEAEGEALGLLARMGEGSMRDAQSLLDQVLAFTGKKKLALLDVESVLGVPPSEAYRRLAAAIVARDTRAALCELKEIFEAGHDIRLFCSNLLEFFRDVMVIQSAGEAPELFDVGKEALAERKALADRFSFHDAHQAYSILQGAEAELRTSDHPRMTLELAVMRMSQLAPVADLEGLIQRIEEAVPARPAPGASASAPDPPA